MPAQKNHNSFDFKCIETSSIHPDNLEATCAYARKFNIDAIALVYINWDKYQLLDYTKEWQVPPIDDEAKNNSRIIQEKIRKGSETVSAHGLDFYIWHHEIKLPPGMIEKYGSEFADFNNPRLWEFIRWKLEMICTLFPKLKGIIFTSGGEILPKTGITLDGAASSMPIAERFYKMYSTVLAVCEKYGKKLIIRNHGFSSTRLKPDNEDLLENFLKGLKPLGNRVSLMAKGVEPDVQPPYPFNTMLAKLARQQPTLMEISLVMEYNGVGRTPFCVPEEIKCRMLFARECGCAGVVARLDWIEMGHQVDRTQRCLGTLNELNAYTFGRLVNEPSLPLESVLHDFANERYGTKAAAAAIEIFKHLYEAGCKKQYVLGMRSIGPANTSGSVYPPELCLGLLNRDALYKYDLSPVSYGRHQNALNPDQHFIDLVVAEKEEALGIYKNSLHVLKANKSTFSEADASQIEHGFKRAILETEIRRDYTAAFFHWLAFKRRGDRPHRKRIDPLLAKLKLNIREYIRLYDNKDEMLPFWEDALRSLAAFEKSLRGLDTYWSECGVTYSDIQSIMSKGEGEIFTLAQDQLCVTIDSISGCLEEIKGPDGKPLQMLGGESANLVQIAGDGMLQKTGHSIHFEGYRYYKLDTGHRLDLTLKGPVELVLSITTSSMVAGVMVECAIAAPRPGMEIILPYINPDASKQEAAPDSSLVAGIADKFKVAVRKESVRALADKEGKKVYMLELANPGLATTMRNDGIAWQIKDGGKMGIILALV